ncbi:DMT family transporter [Roseomonas sp. BN140053]|uniref:DMT family transporter n=1 Tax=Roseomonas sp. BN140053 TaxID=3391898 RepID=UPI0039EB0670
MPPRDLLLGTIVMAVWGSQVVPVRLSLAELPPFLMLAIRWVIVGAVLLPFVPVPRGGQWKTVAAVGVLSGAVHSSLLYLGLLLVPAAVAGVVYQLNVPFALLLGWATLGEAPSRRALAGTALAFAGVVLLSAAGAALPAGGSGPFLLGAGLIAASALCLAAGNVSVRRLPAVPSATLNGWQAPIALVPAVLLSLVAERDQAQAVAQASLTAWIAVFWVALVGGVITWQIWLRLVRRHPVPRVTPLLLLIPPFAIAGGVLGLGERLTALQVVGATLACGGVGLALLPRWRR